MKHTYDDYDFENLYADVYENYFGSNLSIRDTDETYDNFTGSSDDYNYYWN